MCANEIVTIPLKMFQHQSENNPQFDRVVADQRRRRELGTPYHSLRLDSEVWEGIIPLSALEERFRLLGIPEDLTDKTVLDIGCASGWCSFEAERRGAQVTAIDCTLYPDFLYVHRESKSSVRYLELDIDELTVDRLGTFDFVLFLGVLYHLRHPLLGLERVCALTRKCAFIESYTIDAYLEEGVGTSKAIMEFYEGIEMGGQIDNWWGPTSKCIQQMARAAGFACIDHLYTADRRSGFAGKRIAAPRQSGQLRPWLTGATNTRTGKGCFERSKDQYLAAYFRIDSASPVKLTRDDVFMRVGGLDFPAITICQLDEWAWQANFKWPDWFGDSPVEVAVAVMQQVSNAVAVNEGPQNCSSGDRGQDVTISPTLAVFKIDFSPIANHIPGASLTWTGRIFIIESSENDLDLRQASVFINGLPVDICSRGRVGERLWQLSVVVDSCRSSMLSGRMDIMIGDGRMVGDVPFSVYEMKREAPDSWQSNQEPIVD